MRSRGKGRPGAGLQNWAPPPGPRHHTTPLDQRCSRVALTEVIYSDCQFGMFSPSECLV